MAFLPDCHQLSNLRTLLRRQLVQCLPEQSPGDTQLCGRLGGSAPFQRERLQFDGRVTDLLHDGRIKRLVDLFHGRLKQSRRDGELAQYIAGLSRSDAPRIEEVRILIERGAEFFDLSPEPAERQIERIECLRGEAKALLKPLHVLDKDTEFRVERLRPPPPPPGGPPPGARRRRRHLPPPAALPISSGARPRLCSSRFTSSTRTLSSASSGSASRTSLRIVSATASPASRNGPRSFVVAARLAPSSSNF